MSTPNTAPPAPGAPCPCGRGRPYATCCGPLHAGAPAPDAEALMRSRYSAYALGDAAYVSASWHPDTRPADLDLDDAAATRWLGLEVKQHVPIDADHATVEFVARYRTGGAPAVRLHEVSRFERIDGRWYYVNGTFPARQ
ncbi:YchJ family protein [Lysobacter sp.]|uniref:YchJ family protein n=1 Tax=Lysobacter sp. TaxID=72226 RepID=UPI002D5A38CC|nr:YchJ family metal-binding protein [Lysobacter sp.]HZX77550.1 YchJ family metal-binding protein [Lysobacter sp.]